MLQHPVQLALFPQNHIPHDNAQFNAVRFQKDPYAHRQGPQTRLPSPVVPLSNVEAMWERLSPNEQLAIHQQLEELQKKDWKSLSVDEKKAGASVRLRYFISASAREREPRPFC